MEGEPLLHVVNGLHCQTGLTAPIEAERHLPRLPNRGPRPCVRFCVRHHLTVYRERLNEIGSAELLHAMLYRVVAFARGTDQRDD